MRIGAHVVAGGLGRAVGNAQAAGCESLQVFVSNARGWAPPRLDPPADERFRADLAAAGLGPLFVDAPYLVNFASASPVTRERSRDVVAATLAKAAAIGAAGVVVHAGQALASGRPAGLATTREALLPLADAAAQAAPAAAATGPQLVLELTAGTRGALAARFGEMAELLAACGHHPRLTVCMDTCHAQAAGYDLGDPAGAAKALDELFATLGDRVVLVHANDSATRSAAAATATAPSAPAPSATRASPPSWPTPAWPPSRSSPRPRRPRPDGRRPRPPQPPPPGPAAVGSRDEWRERVSGGRPGCGRPTP